jgi:hypothetical protein
VDLDKILYGGDAIKDDLYSILHDPVASAIPKWPTFKLLRWAQLFNRWVDLDKICMEVTSLKAMSITPKWRKSKLLRWGAPFEPIDRIG